MNSLQVCLGAIHGNWGQMQYIKKNHNFNDTNIWQEQLSYVTLKYEVSFSLFFGVIAFGNRPEGLLGGC